MIVPAVQVRPPSCVSQNACPVTIASPSRSVAIAAAITPPPWTASLWSTAAIVCQLLPPSREISTPLYKPDTRIVPSGATLTELIESSSTRLASRCQLAPPSADRYTRAGVGWKPIGAHATTTPGDVPAATSASHPCGHGTACRCQRPGPFAGPVSNVTAEVGRTELTT